MSGRLGTGYHNELCVCGVVTCIRNEQSDGVLDTKRYNYFHVVVFKQGYDPGFEICTVYILQYYIGIELSTNIIIIVNQ